MSENLCVACDRPTPDGYACTACAARAGRQLEEVADMAPAARDVAQRQAVRGSGGSSGKPGSSLPLDLGATARLDAVQNALTTWARHIAGTRQGATWVATADPVVEAARWLTGHLEWLRHRREVSEALSAFEACARVVRRLARGPAEQKYLGPCGALIVAPTDPGLACGCGHDGLDAMFHLKPCPVASTDWRHACEGDVYAPRGARVGRCRTCGAEVATADREAWLDGEVRGHAFRASEIEDAYGINAELIRVWAHRGVVTVHGHDVRGRALYLLSEVLDVAAAQAAKRAEAEAKRARRAAAREDDAA